MGSISPTVESEKSLKKAGKAVESYRAFIRRKLDNGKTVSESKSFPTRAEAKAWLRNTETDTNLSKLTTATGKSLKDIVELFVKAPPIRGTKYWVPAHLDFWIGEFGSKKIGSITRGDINAGIEVLQNKNAFRTSPAGMLELEEKITPATVNRYMASLSSVFNFALARNIIDIHPMKSGNVKKLTESKGRTRILTEVEAEKLMAAAKESSWPLMYLYMRLLITTASRKGEVLKLTWDNTRLDQSIAIVHDTKNGDSRALPLVDDVREELLRLEQAGAREISPIIFYDPRHPARAKNVRELWKSVRKKAGLENDREDKYDRVVMHTTRHTAVTKMIRGGANLAQAAKVSGHKTLSMLKKYEHLDAKDSVDLAQRLLGGKGKS